MQTQNSKNHTPDGQDFDGNSTIQAQAKRSKKLKPVTSNYNDGAILRAKMMRGMSGK